MNPFHFITHQAVRDWEVSMSGRGVDTPVFVGQKVRRQIRVNRLITELRGRFVSVRRSLSWES